MARTMGAPGGIDDRTLKILIAGVVAIATAVAAHFTVKKIKKIRAQKKKDVNKKPKRKVTKKAA